MQPWQERPDPSQEALLPDEAVAADKQHHDLDPSLLSHRYCGSAAVDRIR